MKIKYLVFALLILGSSMEAQFIRGYGFKLGATIATQDWNTTSSIKSNIDNRTGLNFGAFIEFLDIPFFSVVPELNYFQKGLKQEYPATTIEQPNGTGQIIKYDARVDYFNLSLYAKLRMDYGIIRPYLIVGPKVDFKLGESYSVGSSNEVVDNFKKNISGYRVGIGTEVNLVVINALAEVVYDGNFGDVFKNENVEVKSSSIDLRVGIMF